MTSEDSVDLREVIFINERCKFDYEGMPHEVRESADQAINALQNNRTLSRKMHQSLQGTLAGVNEIRIPYDANTYRVYLTLKCAWIVMVLDAGIKKSTARKNIPKWQQERLEARYKAATQYCAEYDGTLKAAYDKRGVRRAEITKLRSR